MKKIFSMVIAAAMVLMMAACAGNNENNNSDNNDANANAPASALEALQNIWAKYTEDDQFFAAGGDNTAPVDNAPGAVTLTNTEYLTNSLVIPTAVQSSITEAASLMHSMNANTFTGAAYRVSDVNGFAAAMHSALQGNQWICGTPEKLAIASLGGGYVVVAFGVADVMNGFQNHLKEAYPAAQMLFNEAISG